MTTDSIKVSGAVEIIIKDFNGNIERRTGKNLVVSGGQNLFAALIAGMAVDAPSHIAVGNSTLTPGKSQTDLQGTEHERVAADVSVTDNTIIITATLGAGIATDVQCAEFGLFNGTDPSGILVARWTTPEFSLPSTSSIEIVWRLTLGG